MATNLIDRISNWFGITITTTTEPTINEYFVKIAVIGKYSKKIEGVFSYCIDAPTGGDALRAAFDQLETDSKLDGRASEVIDIKRL